jgi:uncharacterized integral membrane protein (TIGR00697 family)
MSGRFYPAIVSLFAVMLAISNIMAVKLVSLFGLYLPAAVILFPVTYIFGDVLTEVYGYGRARQAIWIGFGCNLLAVIALWLGGQLTPAPFWTAGSFASPEAAQAAYSAILGFAPRLLAASFVAYLAGEFLNSYIMARMKVATQGRYLWMRTIGSTLAGEGVDSAIFITLAFGGVLAWGDLGATILSQWLFKSAYESLATPLTYWVVNALKRTEGLDIFDRETEFNPVRF